MNLDVKTTADWISWSSDTQKFTWQWTPNEIQPRATIGIIHGLGEHGGRYETTGQRFASHGFQTFAFDQQGHGRDDRKRGCIKSYESLLDDIHSFLKFAKLRHPSIPLILFGHSMGGNLVTNYSLRRESIADAVIASSPMLRTTRKISKWFEWLCRGLKVILPNQTMKSEVLVERLMSDPDEQSRFRADSIFHNRMSLRLAASLLDSGEWAIQNAERLAQPMLLVHGTDDLLTCPAASQEFASAADADCEAKIYPDVLHDTFRCHEKERVYADFFDFIERQVK